jgi:hypothetical protein
VPLGDPVSAASGPRPGQGGTWGRRRGVLPLASPSTRSGATRPESLVGSGQAARFRHAGAQLAEQVAAAADTFASILEEAAARGDRTRRLRLAATERQIAEIGRRKAANLRNHDGGYGPVTLERLPALPDDLTCHHRASPVTRSARTPSGPR